MGELRKLKTFEFGGLEWAVWKGQDEYLLTRTYSEPERVSSKLLDADSDDKTLREFSFARAIFDRNCEIVEKVFNPKLEGFGLEDAFFGEVEADLEGKVGQNEQWEIPALMGFRCEKSADRKHKEFIDVEYRTYVNGREDGHISLKICGNEAKITEAKMRTRHSGYSDLVKDIGNYLSKLGVKVIHGAVQSESLRYFFENGFQRASPRKYRSDIGWLIAGIFSNYIEKQLEQSPVVKK